MVLLTSNFEGDCIFMKEIQKRLRGPVAGSERPTGTCYWPQKADFGWKVNFLKSDQNLSLELLGKSNWCWKQSKVSHNHKKKLQNFSELEDCSSLGSTKGKINEIKCIITSRPHYIIVPQRVNYCSCEILIIVFQSIWTWHRSNGFLCTFQWPKRADFGWKLNFLTLTQDVDSKVC